MHAYADGPDEVPAKLAWPPSHLLLYHQHLCLRRQIHWHPRPPLLLPPPGFHSAPASLPPQLGRHQPLPLFQLHLFYRSNLSLQRSHESRPNYRPTHAASLSFHLFSSTCTSPRLLRLQNLSVISVHSERVESSQAMPSPDQTRD